ncbi:MAG TPA: type ISP restriction/modification enzyme [Hanamia sp.]
MTLQQYEENTFSIQPFFTTNSEAGDQMLQSSRASFHVPFGLSLETDELKNIYAKLKNPPNLPPEIVIEIANRLGLTYIAEKEIPAEGSVCFANSREVRPEFRLTFAATDIFDYIYAVLHSTAYKNKYKEFLKIDAPRVPYPKDSMSFWQLVKPGGELKQAHLSELIETERIMKEIDKVEAE